MLRPLWLIALLAAVYLAFLATFGLLPDFAEQTRTPITLLRLAQFLPLVLFFPLMGMLAGMLSLGDLAVKGDDEMLSAETLERVSEPAGVA